MKQNAGKAAVVDSGDKGSMESAILVGSILGGDDSV
jgi:hypothetical protein